MIFINGIIGKDVTLLGVVAAAKADNEPILRVMIDSPGGYVEEGRQIYAFLKNYKDRPVHTYARGTCASMAAQIFIAGSQRFIGCEYMIHNPAIAPEGERMESSDLRGHADYLDALKKEAIKEYVEVTGLDAQVISDFMDNETWIQPDQAISLNFATAKYEIKAVALYGEAQIKSSKTKQKESMKNSKLKAAVSQFIDSMFGGGADPVSLDLTDVNGNVLTVERETGDPQVGDVAMPDGEYTMADGVVITVAGGVISDIVTPMPDETEELRAQLAEKDTEIARLKEELGTANSLKTQAASLVKDLNTELESSEKELETLRAKQKAVGSYAPEGRAAGKKADDESDIIKYAAEKKAEREAKRKK